MLAVGFDWTISLNTVITVLTLVLTAVALFNALSARLSIFEAELRNTAESQKEHSERTEIVFRDHAKRLDRHEEKILVLVSDLQRLIGRSEISRQPLR